MTIVFSKYRAWVSEASNGHTGALMLESKCSGTSILWQILLMFANESRKPDVSRNHLMATESKEFMNS